MAQNQSFNIRQGLSEQLFESDGITPKSDVKLELGCWYLCIDTVCVYVCVKKDINGEDIDSNKTLKKVNASSFDAVDERIDALELAFDDRISTLENEVRYEKIGSEEELPTDFEAPTFDPKTAYYIVTDEAMGFISLYVFDEGIQGYLCTNKSDLDFSDLEKKIAAVVEDKFDEFAGETLDTKLDEKLEEKVPSVVKTVIETQILFGGNSTTTTADDKLN